MTFKRTSLLMDEPTLLAHRDVWGTEPQSKRFSGKPPNLSSDEQTLHHTLATDKLVLALRLKQEHIRQSWLLQALTRISHAAIQCTPTVD